jgi:hypothetical protein
MTAMEFILFLGLVLFLALWLGTNLKIQKELRYLRKQVEVEGGPFISAQVRFPRKLKRFVFAHEVLQNFHVHRMTPKRIESLIRHLKVLTDIPQGAVIHSASVDISKDQWEIVLSDDSFDPVEDHGVEIPMGSITISDSELVRRMGLQNECSVCAMEAMEKNHSSVTPNTAVTNR